MSSILRPEYVVVVQGEDRSVALRINNNDGTPYNLTGNTDIKARFRKADNTVLQLTKSLSNGAKATAVYQSVIYTAVDEGILGNTIALVFNGTLTIQQVVDAWNVANPTKTLVHNAANSAIRPTAGTVTLTGGVDPYSSITILDAVSGRIAISMSDIHTLNLRVGDRQDFTIILEAGTTTRIANFARALNIVRSLV